MWIFLVIFMILWVSISLTERNNCNFPAGLKEFFLNSGGKGLILAYLSEKHSVVYIWAWLWFELIVKAKKSVMVVIWRDVKMSLSTNKQDIYFSFKMGLNENAG